MAVTENGRLPEGTVTLLFTDIEGSTRLLHELGDFYGDVLAEHDRLLRHVWTEHGGVVVDTEGDAFFVVFAHVAEAVAAAAAAQSALDMHRWPHGVGVRIRMGVHTGSPRLRGNTYWGVDVHYAARLCAAAHGGQVLLSESTRALVADVSVDDLGEHGLKDFVVPRRLFHLRLGGAGADRFPPPKTLARVRTNLPSLPNRLIGREAELAEMRGALTGAARLLTVTGVGGSGKTRIALACGTELLDVFSDGVFLVRLASVERPGAVVLAIAEALGVPVEDGRDPESAIASHLARREMLVIVDNMEHLLDAGPVLARLLGAAPGVRLLVTSQAPLRLTYEVVMPLAQLDVPAAGERDMVALERVPAASLFLERARAADASFALAPDDAPTVAELCRRLDGLPLALEIAAAGVRMGGPRRLLAALERGIDALGSGARDLPERQRGLRAALDYTISLLGEEPRRLLGALGVFAGAWTIEQTETMFSDELDVWEATALLLDFALVRTRGDGRLAMAEPIRAYAQALLAQQGQEHDCRRRHALMLAEEAEGIDDEFFFRTPVLTARTLELADEYGSAVRWSSDHDLELHRRLVGALGIPYYLANRIASIADEVFKHLPIVECDDYSARLQVAHGMVLASNDDIEGAFAAFGRAADCRRRLDDHTREAVARAVQAHLLGQSGIYDERAAHLLTAALTLPAVDHNPQLRALLMGELALHHVNLGRTEEADPILSEILADSRLDGSFISMCAMDCWGDLAMARDEFDIALDRYAHTLRAARVMPINGLQICSGIARALAGLGQDDVAVELDAGVEANFEREGSVWARESIAPAPQRELQLMAAARTRLGSDAAAQARRRGRDHERDELIDLALALADEHAARHSQTTQAT
jgi:predicted ATPase/class 3 adenylate cyclase